jgi:RNA polymerase sigma factor (sigma-70 family)
MEHDSDRREGTFNGLYDAHHDAVRAYAWRRDPVFADDIVAETFLVAWKRLDDVPRDAALPWLLAVARNTHLNIQRGERRRREREAAEAFTLPDAQNDEPHADVSTADENPVLQLLKRLPEADQEVLLLVAWEGLDQSAVARVLGCSRANVALRLHRARRRFQALLASADAEQPGPAGSSRGGAGSSATPDRGSRLIAGGFQHD